VGFHVEFEKTAYWQRDVGRKLQFSATQISGSKALGSCVATVLDVVPLPYD
jgi:hypothetical protein